MKKTILAMVGSICFAFLFLGCNGKEISDLQQENKALKEKVVALEAENVKLRETADFHYKAGVDYLNAKDWEKAKTEFACVVQKFPQSSLVVNAKNGFSKAENEIAAEKRAIEIAEEQERRKKEKAERLAGTPIDYSVFFAKVNGGGLPSGKRYSFSACMYRNTLCIDLPIPGNFDKHLCGTIADFDNIQTLENFRAASGSCGCGNVTASIGYEGRVHVHRFDGQ